MSGENPPAIVRTIFAAIFIAACLYSLELGVRVAGMFILGLSLHQGIQGRIPLVGSSWKTKGYLTGAAALTVSAFTIFVSTFFIFAPGMIIRLMVAIAANDHHAG